MVLMFKTKEKVYKHVFNPSNINCKRWKLLEKLHIKCFRVTVAGLDHEDKIWPTPAGDKLWEFWEEVKKKCPYFYKVKLFVKERLTAKDETIRNSTDPIDSSGILRDRKAEKNDGNQGALFDNEEGRSLGTQDNSVFISDDEENPNILDAGLKKSRSSGQARYGYPYLLKFKCNELIF